MGRTLQPEGRDLVHGIMGLKDLKKSNYYFSEI